jgi:hypothetical protein
MEEYQTTPTQGSKKQAQSNDSLKSRGLHGEPKTPTGETYVRSFRAESQTLKLWKESPNAFLLLNIIAHRAWRGLGVSERGAHSGQAFVGDHEALGMTRQEYRTACKLLEKLGYARFEGSRWIGTTATLLPNPFFDINIAGPTMKLTMEQPSQVAANKGNAETVNPQLTMTATINKNSLQEREEKKLSGEVVREYGKTKGYPQDRVEDFIRLNATKGTPLANWRKALDAFTSKTPPAKQVISSPSSVAPSSASREIYWYPTVVNARKEYSRLVSDLGVVGGEEERAAIQAKIKDPKEIINRFVAQELNRKTPPARKPQREQVEFLRSKRTRELGNLPLIQDPAEREQIQDAAAKYAAALALYEQAA